jgi:hypothetical protein
MKYLKFLIVCLFSSLTFFSCIEEGDEIMPAPDARIENMSKFLGRWNAYEVSKKWWGWDVRPLNPEIEHSLTINKDNTMTIVRRGISYTGTWELASTNNYFEISIPDEQLPPDFPVPTQWAVMRADDSELWLNSGGKLVKLKR